MWSTFKFSLVVEKGGIVYSVNPPYPPNVHNEPKTTFATSSVFPYFQICLSVWLRWIIVRADGFEPARCTTTELPHLPLYSSNCRPCIPALKTDRKKLKWPEGGYCTSEDCMNSYGDWTFSHFCLREERERECWPVTALPPPPSLTPSHTTVRRLRISWAITAILIKQLTNKNMSLQNVFFIALN